MSTRYKIETAFVPDDDGGHIEYNGLVFTSADITTMKIATLEAQLAAMTAERDAQKTEAEHLRSLAREGRG